VLGAAIAVEVTMAKNATAKIEVLTMMKQRIKMLS